MNENQLGKYLLYALGEIILVVIGILIAFNANNWNEQRKSRAIELKYFKNLKTDLLADIISIEDMIAHSDKKINAARSLKINSDRLDISSLFDFANNIQDLLWVNEFRPNNNTFEEMKNSGHYSSIQNDYLKFKLMDLQKTYSEIDRANEHFRNDYNVFLEDFIHYVDWGKYYDLPNSNIAELETSFDSAYVNSHETQLKAEIQVLFKNKVFLNNLYLFEVNYTYIKNSFINTKRQVNEMVKILSTEIDKG